MVFNTDVEESKPNNVFVGNDERKSSESKTTLDKLSSEKSNEAVDPGTPISLKTDSIAVEAVDSYEMPTLIRPATTDVTVRKRSHEKLAQAKSESCLGNKKLRNGEEQQRAKATLDQEQPSKTSEAVVDNHKREVDVQKKLPVAVKLEDISCKISGGKNVNAATKIGKLRVDLQHKRPSEIPKLKSLPKAGHGMQQKPSTFQSRLPVKTPEKDSERKPCQDILNGLKNREESMKTMIKSYSAKKDTKVNEKIKEAMAQDFGYLVPLYEKEFKKISDVWMNTIYCSLTMRTNLVKLLFQAFPNINRTQFQMEDDRLLHCIANAKNCTKLEAENLIKFIKTLVVNREKTKEDYRMLMVNKEIADCYNNDWKKLIRKVAFVGEEAKNLQMETPELQKKKEANEINMNEKIRRMEINLCKKEEEIKKLMNQLNMLKQKESSYRDNVLLKSPDYKEIRADVQSLISIQKEFDDLRGKYMLQNYTYEKKIRDLESLVEEKRKVLEKEREVKKQLQALLNQLQAHQKRLTASIGKEQVDYIMGRSFQGRGKRREQLWLAAVKLVLRGFLVQMKKLERDRNKMLLELQMDDLENSEHTLSLIQKDNFIKTIKQQMNDLQKGCTYSNTKNLES